MSLSPQGCSKSMNNLRTRVLRFCMGLAGLAYLRKTWTSFFQQRAMLRLQGAAMHYYLPQDPRHQQRNLLWSILKYTLSGQLIAASEYLIPLVKPLLAARIGRLLVWKGPRVEPNAKYGPHERNTVDIYGVERANGPDNGDNEANDKRKPVLVFVHGGAWSFGHKWQYGLVGEYLSTSLGFLVAVVNYRTYPTGHVQNMVEDVEQAVRTPIRFVAKAQSLEVEWVMKKCHLFGGDKNQIFLGGHSSGAHVGALTLIQSAMRVASPDQKQKKSEVADVVKGFIGLAGPYDIADHYVFESERCVGPFQGVHEISTMKPAVLGVENFKVHSPTALVTEAQGSGGGGLKLKLKLPKFHVLHGLDDAVVPSSSSEKFAHNLKRAGQQADFLKIQNCTHEDIIFAVMGDNVPCRAQVVKHIQRIMSSISTPGKEEEVASGASKALVRPMAKL